MFQRINPDGTVQATSATIGLCSTAAGFQAADGGRPGPSSSPFTAAELGSLDDGHTITLVSAAPAHHAIGGATGCTTPGWWQIVK